MQNHGKEPRDAAAGTARGGVLAELNAAGSRREFLKRAAIGSAVAVLPSIVVGCTNDDDQGSVGIIGATTDPAAGSGALITLDFSKEVDVLRYASALEELEGAFYDRAVQNIGRLNLSAANQTLVAEAQQNELAHRYFFRTALGTNLVKPTPRFSAVDFNNATAVLTLLRTFCDVGTSAYNGGGRYLTDPNLTIAGKIVSIEARHVAMLREILQPGTAYFAGDDVVNPTNGLDVVNGLDPNQPVPPTLTPNEVLRIAQPYMVERVTVINF